MARKKLFETKIGKLLLTPTAVGAVKAIPIVGPMLSNILDQNGSDAGSVDKRTIKSDIIAGAVVLVVIAYLLGWISPEQADTAKEILTQD